MLRALNRVFQLIAKASAWTAFVSAAVFSVAVALALNVDLSEGGVAAAAQVGWFSGGLAVLALLVWTGLYSLASLGPRGRMRPPADPEEHAARRRKVKRLARSTVFYR